MIGCGVTIGENTVVSDSVIMTHAVIGKDGEIHKAIIAEHAKIGDRVKMGIGEPKENEEFPHIYAQDIVTVGEKSFIPDDITIGKNTVIFGETIQEDYEGLTLPSGKSLIKAGDWA